MAIEKAVFQRRLTAVRKRFQAAGADALYATPSSNLFYLTGIAFNRSERLTALLLFKDRAPVVICPAFEAARMRAMSAIEEVRTWEETEDPFRLAASFLHGALCRVPPCVNLPVHCNRASPAAASLTA